jgi:hypothetical protein
MSSSSRNYRLEVHGLVVYDQFGDCRAKIMLLTACSDPAVNPDPGIPISSQPGRYGVLTANAGGPWCLIIRVGVAPWKDRSFELTHPVHQICTAPNSPFKMCQIHHQRLGFDRAAWDGSLQTMRAAASHALLRIQISCLRFLLFISSCCDIICCCVQSLIRKSHSTRLFPITTTGLVGMTHLKIRHVLLALFVAAASSNRHQVYSLAVSHRSTPAVSVTGPVNKLAQLVPAITKYCHFKKFAHVNVNNTNTKLPAHQTFSTKHLLERADADGPDSFRTAASSREWISTLVDMVVMAMLGLASIVVAVVLGYKQLQATRAQSQLMLDPRRHLHVDNIELINLGSARVNCSRDRMHARPEIVGVDPSRQADLSTEFPGFFLGSRSSSYSFSGDQLPQAVRNHSTNVHCQRVVSESDFLHHGCAQSISESQPPADMTDAGNYIQFGRQDSATLTSDHNRELGLLVILGKSAD